VGVEISSPVGRGTAGGRLADELRRIGREAGLDAVGICDASVFAETRAAIEDRKASGLAAGMQFTYRNPARATDPQSTLPGARALFVGARRYLRQAPPGQPAGPPRGRVARYSWVDHYRPLRTALDLVAAKVIESGWQARVVADDNALVDRAAAVRAGIGWYGKNSNVLLPGAGSWFVIGSVITDAPIAPLTAPVPVPDGCGSCQRCIASCPTGALVAPGVLDARRCLAWLLQAPGVFPREHREALGDRLYGCDDCQDSCPVNHRAERKAPPPGPEAASQPSLDILALLSLDDASLMDLVGRWYIPKRQARYVRRNALVVLGNTAHPGDPGVGDALDRALADPDPIVRAHAVWAAGRLGRVDLVQDHGDDPDPLVLEEIMHLRASSSAPGWR
jgi:epoxyqueuosine reductase